MSSSPLTIRPDPLALTWEPRGFVLIVDDCCDAANVLAELVRRLGHEAHAVYDGREAIRQTALLSPDMVLLDIGMAEVDGYDVATSIRRQPGGSHIVIVAITGFTGEDAKRHAYRAGFDRYLIKPTSLDDLKELLGILQP